MKHLLLTLFAFLSFQFTTTTHAQDLTLTEVSVDTVELQKIKLKWLYEKVDSVSIFLCDCMDENLDKRIAKVPMNPNNLEWIDESANPNSFYYYRIGWSNSGKSIPLNNIVLNIKKTGDGCLNSVLLSWNPYINMPDSLDHYKIFVRTNTDADFKFLHSLRGKHHTGLFCSNAHKESFQVKNLKNNTIYEFVIQAVNKKNNAFSFSNIAKYEIKGVEDTAATAVRISCVSVTDDGNIQIDVNTDDFIVPFQKLYLYRDDFFPPAKPEKDLQFKLLDSLEYNSSNLYQFIDKKNVASNTKLYYYKVIAENLCRFNDTSNVKTNILLFGSRIEKYKDTVQFMHAEFPAPDDNSYEIYRIVYGDSKSIETGLFVNTTYYYDVTTFMDDGASVQYQIKSKQGCLSNILSVAHEPVVDFPDAFYPLSRNYENRTFYPILKFPEKDSYLFIIYDRWGQELYRSTLPPDGDYFNTQGRWDGTFKGNDCPPGIYSFQLSYRFSDGTEKYSKSGTFMLIR